MGFWLTLALGVALVCVLGVVVLGALVMAIAGDGPGDRADERGGGWG
jgi:hypothetical protein